MTQGDKVVTLVLEPTRGRRVLEVVVCLHGDRPAVVAARNAITLEPLDLGKCRFSPDRLATALRLDRWARRNAELFRAG